MNIRKKNLERKKKLFIGKQFENLLVKEFYGYNKNKQLLWLCECQCKNKTKVIATSTDLTSKKKTNCGCLTKIKQRQSKKKINKYNLTGEYGIGYTNKGEEFYFDLEDYDKIKNYCWNIHKSKKLSYVEAKNNNNKIIKMHRLIMNVQGYKIKIDHINHKGYDNRKINLRKTSNQENSMNHLVQSNNTSGVSGISDRKDSNKWRARIWYNYKCIDLGSYDNFDDAVIARKRAEDKYFGKFKIREDII